jgi:hypothetical protein
MRQIRYNRIPLALLASLITLGMAILYPFPAAKAQSCSAPVSGEVDYYSETNYCGTYGYYEITYTAYAYTTAGYNVGPETVYAHQGCPFHYTQCNCSTPLFTPGLTNAVYDAGSAFYVRSCASIGGKCDTYSLDFDVTNTGGQPNGSCGGGASCPNGSVSEEEDDETQTVSAYFNVNCSSSCS